MFLGGKRAWYDYFIAGFLAGFLLGNIVLRSYLEERYMVDYTRDAVKGD